MNNKIDISLAEKNFKDLHKAIYKNFISLDKKIKISTSNWKYKTGGGGKSIILRGNKIIEQAGVNFSSIKGKILPGSALSKKFSKHMKEFYATGLSVVAHTSNPFAPCSHLNVRFFMTKDKNNKIKWWFGGGFDLTPYFPYTEDTKLWHKNAKNLCDKYDKTYYKKFKKDCDEYFFIKHRNENRGIGGIFFDGLNKKNFSHNLSFVNDVGHTYIQTYCGIIIKRSSKKFNKTHKDFQLYRRSRYVEFNLMYDRGTLFGLQSGGRIDSILVSLPPKVIWNIPKSAVLKRYETNLLKILKKN